MNVAFSGPELVDFFVVYVKANDLKAGLHELADQGKADVAKADDADHSLFGADLGEQAILEVAGGLWVFSAGSVRFLLRPLSFFV